MENSKNKKIEIISNHTDIKESDKREGILMYGSKPLEEEKEGKFRFQKTAKELAMEGKIAWDKKDKTKKEEVETEIEETKEKIAEYDKRLAELDTEGKKLIEELKKVNYDDDQIKNLLEKRTKKENPPINNEIKNKNVVSTTPNENKEKKEQYSREQLLNAAEIFCKYNEAAYYKDSKERKTAEERALAELKIGHSEREITAAINVSGKRNEMFGLKDEIKRIQKEYKIAKDNPYAKRTTVKKKYEQQIQDIKRKMRLIDNDYTPLLRELKIANLDSQLKNLEKYRDHTDFKEKIEDAELFALSMIQTEMVRYQDAKVSSNSVINPKGWDFIKNNFKRNILENRFFQGYMKMGRGKKMAISAAMIGAGVGFVPGSVVAGVLSLVAGSVGGYFLSKKVFQPLAHKAYEHDSAKILKEQQEKMIGVKGVEKKVKNEGKNKEKWWKFWKKSEKESENITEEKEIVGAKKAAEEMKHLEQLARGEIDPSEREKILGKIADFNITLCEKYTDKIRRNEKYFIANNILGTVAAGLIAGQGARMMTNWIVGPSILEITGTPKSGPENIIENHPKQGGNFEESPELEGDHTLPEVIVTPKSGPIISDETMNAATVGEGEGVEHVLRRQLEMNPDKFGFSGDIGDKVAIHEWSGGKAHLIAIDQGYVKGGTESWVRDMGPDGPKGNPAYVLEIDASGKTTIQEYFEGKPSGTGGLNNTYEYEHASPTSQRYTSVIDNTPDNTSPKGLEIIKENEGPMSEYREITEETPAETSQENISRDYLTEEELKKINNVYNENIEHLFPNREAMDVWDEIKDNPNLPAETLLKENVENVEEVYQPLVSHLQKLHEVTGLKSRSETIFQPAETSIQYMRRAVQKAIEIGQLDKVKL